MRSTTDKVLGAISRHAPSGHRAEFGYWVGPGARGRGVDTSALRLIVEWTLATTDLGHINAKLIRYRTSVLRAIEADSQKEFLNIASAWPERRSQIEQTLDRFIKAADSVTSRKGQITDELRELQAVKARLGHYMASSEQTIGLIKRRWQTTSQEEAKRLRDAAEENAAEHGGARFIDVTLELDLLLEVVALIAGEVRDEADGRLRMMSAIVVGDSALLVGLVLFTSTRSPRPKT